jgi:hypothetical protein
MKRLPAILALMMIAILAGIPSNQATAQEPNRAGIVVYFGEGRTSSVCVSFDESEISGLDLLHRAGFPVVASNAWGGGATCMIDGVGCADPNDCWCQCHGTPCRYWAYYTLEGDQWRYSPTGAAQRKLRDGDVDGWAWGIGSAGSAEKLLPPTTYDEVCPPAMPTPIPPPPALDQLPPTEAVTTSLPSSNATVEQRALPATIMPPTSTPPAISTSAAAAPASKEESDSGFPWQIPAFAALAAVLVGVAFTLARRRSRG